MSDSGQDEALAINERSGRTGSRTS
jgi:hypothetical protein